jgi:hypothetical protein
MLDVYEMLAQYIVVLVVVVLVLCRHECTVVGVTKYQQSHLQLW